MTRKLKNEDAAGRDLQAVFEQLEQEGLFNNDINPINWDGAAPVDQNFPYIPKGRLKLKYALMNVFIVRLFRWYQAKVIYKVKTVGKENLKGIKSAIVTSNHVAIFDCMVNGYVLRRHNVKTVAAEFNNLKGRFGECMRAGGMLPLGSKRETMRKFSETIEYYLSRNHYILFYPEQSMWPLYDKPRPYKSGAFHYAVKHDVPVIPMFITYRDGKLDKDGNKRVYFTLNISKPVYPDKTLPFPDQVRQLSQKAYDACVGIYEKTYNKKLTYKGRDEE